MAARRAPESLEETAARRQDEGKRAVERRLNESLEEAAARMQDLRDRAAERLMNVLRMQLLKGKI